MNGFYFRINGFIIILIGIGMHMKYFYGLHELSSTKEAVLYVSFMFLSIVGLILYTIGSELKKGVNKNV